MPLVSVVMASYNHGQYVGHAVQSVLDQTLQDFELVVTDDGSADETVAEIAKFTDPRIRLFRFPANRGQFVATNQSLRQARGQYVAVLNSDDAFLPAKLEKQVAFLADHPEVGAVFSRVRLIDEQDRICRGRTMFSDENRSRFQWLRHFFHVGNCLCHPSVLLRRQCHETIGGYDERYAQLADYDLWVRLCLEYEMHILPEELTAFRILPRSANMSSRRPDSIRRGYWEHRRIYDNYLSIRSPELLRCVFPEAARYGDDLEEELIPFVLAQLALQTRHRKKIHQAFALDTLFRLLGEPGRAEKLEKRFGFGCCDFIELTGRCDAFNAYAMRRIRAERLGFPRGPWARFLRALGRRDRRSTGAGPLQPRQEAGK
jgi:glycosyltransferase involved in cell wall biosynthesis